MPKLVRPQVPLADVRGLVMGLPQDAAKPFVIRADAQLIDHHARAAGAFAGEQRCPVRRAQRVA